MRATLGHLPDGVPGTLKTLAHMRQLIESPRYFSLPVYVATRRLVASLPPKAYAAEARALFNFVQNQIRYVREPAEVLQEPWVTLRLRAGDCDDKVTLLGSMLHSVGVRVRLVVGGYQRGEFVHVWLRALIAGRWVGMDATEPYPMGWEPSLPVVASYGA